MLVDRLGVSSAAAVVPANFRLRCVRRRTAVGQRSFRCSSTAAGPHRGNSSSLDFGDTSGRLGHVRSSPSTALRLLASYAHRRQPASRCRRRAAAPSPACSSPTCSSNPKGACAPRVLASTSRRSPSRYLLRPICSCCSWSRRRRRHRTVPSRGGARLLGPHRRLRRRPGAASARGRRRRRGRRPPLLPPRHVDLTEAGRPAPVTLGRRGRYATCLRSTRTRVAAPPP